MSRVSSFPPEAGAGARVLILGSMPGRASLAAGQYYAHPRNLFWPIVSGILKMPASLPYRRRLARLKKARVALWDVLESCVRPGSSDSAIERGSVRPNDLAGLLRARPGIRTVLFNGAKAEECYRRYVAPSLPPSAARLKYARLPSTSPAHASLPRRRKYGIWKAALSAAIK